jgi:predicted ribosomally synthesized peptide with SipW-like signal peptide
MFLFVMWGVLGTGTTLAWFTDTSPVQKNIFHVAELDLDVSYRLSDGSYKTVEMSTDVFNDHALYEPGYVQVVVLKIKNNGDVAFDYKTELTVTDYIPAINVFGDTFKLQDYLKFGFITADTEAELDALLSERSRLRLSVRLNGLPSLTTAGKAFQNLYKFDKKGCVFSVFVCVIDNHAPLCYYNDEGQHSATR